MFLVAVINRWELRSASGFSCFGIGLFERDLLRELAQEAHVTFEEEADIGDPVKEHGDAFNADAEGPTAPYFRIDIASFEDVGIDHAGAQNLNPATPFAESAPLLATENTRDIDFDARFREREETRPQPNLGVFAEERLGKELKDTTKMCQIEAFLNMKPLDLMEHGGMRHVVIAAVDGAGRDDADGRFIVEHRAHLNRARVRTEQGAIFKHQGILHVACRMVCWEIQGFEIEIIPFGLRPLCDFKPHGEKDVFDFTLCLLEDVFCTADGRSSRQREVFVAKFEVSHELRILEFDFDFCKLGFKTISGFIDERAEFGTFGGSELFHVLHVGLDFTFFPKIFFY